MSKISVDSTNIFKNRLDKFWYNQDLKFNCNTDIAGIGSRRLKVNVCICNNLCTA